MEGNTLVNEKLSKAKEILNKRLDGLVLTCLYDIVENVYIPSTFDTGVNRHHKDICLPFVAEAMIALAGESTCQFNAMDSNYLMWEYGDSSAVAFQHNGIVAIIVSKDKLGDICFHSLWSEDASLGAFKQICTGIDEYLVPQGVSRSREVTSSSIADDTSVNVVYVGDNFSEESTSLADWFDQLILAGSVANPSSGYEFQSYLQTSESLVKLSTICKVGRSLSSFSECEHTTFDGLSIFCIVTDDEQYMGLKNEAGGFELVAIQGDYENLGRLLYLGRGGACELAVSNIERRCVQQRIFPILSEGQARIHDVLIYAFGSCKDKLPWMEALQYPPLEQVGEYMGLFDIGTSLKELADDIDWLVCNKNKVNENARTILLEYEGGCCVLESISGELYLVVVAQDQTANVLDSVRKVAVQLKEEIPFVCAGDDYAFPEGHTILGNLNNMNLSEDSEQVVRNKLSSAQGLIFASYRASEELVCNDSVSLSHYLGLASSNQISPLKEMIYQALDRFISKSSVFSQHALKDIMGTLKAISIGNNNGMTIDIFGFEGPAHPFNFLCVAQKGDILTVRKTSLSIANEISASDRTTEVGEFNGESSTQTETSARALSFKNVSLHCSNKKKLLFDQDNPGVKFSKQLFVKGYTLRFNPSPDLFNGDESLKVCMYYSSDSGSSNKEVEDIKITSESVFVKFPPGTPLPNENFVFNFEVIDLAGRRVCNTPSFIATKIPSIGSRLASFFGGLGNYLRAGLSYGVSQAIVSPIYRQFPGLVDERYKTYLELALFAIIMLIVFFIWEKIKQKK